MHLLLQRPALSAQCSMLNAQCSTLAARFAVAASRVNCFAMKQLAGELLRVETLRGESLCGNLLLLIMSR
jgi:uncharacterized membrane protein